MNKNSMAIVILCSHICLGENSKPFEPSEWSKLAEKLIELNLTPSDLLSLEITELKKNFTDEEVTRINILSSRSASISFELNKYRDQGIEIVTRADKNYPRILKDRLKKTCPPLFYYIGDLSICNKKSIGFVGSRTIEDKDIIFTQNTVRKAIKEGYAIVSGGAKGVDTISADTTIENDGFVIEYISDSLLRRVKKKDVIEAIRKKQLVILSTAKPDAGFNTGMAMARNKFIYSQSEATVVVRSEYNKGGTWSGANEALKKEYCNVLVWDKKEYSGNKAIIENGAAAIDEKWDGSIIAKKKNKVEQLSLF